MSQSDSAAIDGPAQVVVAEVSRADVMGAITAAMRRVEALACGAHRPGAVSAEARGPGAVDPATAASAETPPSSSCEDWPG